MGEAQISQAYDSDKYQGVKDSLVAGRKEIAFFLALLVVYFYLRFSGIEPTGVVVLGLIGGTWLAFRPSEWAVEGMESAAGHLGFTAYVAGMMSVDWEPGFIGHRCDFCSYRCRIQHVALRIHHNCVY